MQRSKLIAKNVRVELSPAARANPPDPIEFVKALVEQHFAELVVRRDDFTFRPFFDEKSVSREIKRLQTVPESLAWGGVFREYGCFRCGRKNLPYGASGCCQSCYALGSARKKSWIRRNGPHSDDLEFRLSTCDQEKLARAALMGGVVALPSESANSVLVVGGAQSAIEIAPRVIEPERHSAWCVICKSPNREAIEHDFVAAGEKYGAVRGIMRKYRLKGTAGLYKHARAFGLNAKRVERITVGGTR